MDNLHRGGIIEGPSPLPGILNTGCDFVIPRAVAERWHLHLDAINDTPCPYCSMPQGWDACPIHRDGNG